MNNRCFFLGGSRHLTEMDVPGPVKPEVKFLKSIVFSSAEFLHSHIISVPPIERYEKYKLIGESREGFVYELLPEEEK